MVMNEKELIERDSCRDIWQETLDAVRDIKAGKVGHVETVQLLPVVEARCKLSRAAMSIIQIAKQRPDVLREVFG